MSQKEYTLEYLYQYECSFVYTRSNISKEMILKAITTLYSMQCDFIGIAGWIETVDNYKRMIKQIEKGELKTDSIDPTIGNKQQIEPITYKEHNNRLSALLSIPQKRKEIFDATVDFYWTNPRTSSIQIDLSIMKSAYRSEISPQVIANYYEEPQHIKHAYTKDMKDTAGLTSEDKTHGINGKSISIKGDIDDYSRTFGPGMAAYYEELEAGYSNAAMSIKKTGEDRLILIMKNLYGELKPDYAFFDVDPLMGVDLDMRQIRFFNRITILSPGLLNIEMKKRLLSNPYFSYSLKDLKNSEQSKDDRIKKLYKIEELPDGGVLVLPRPLGSVDDFEFNVKMIPTDQKGIPLWN
jgi:hypothetical protein